ncbi:hypothetical protein C8J57DRAFT_1019963, partial [Mycena rebaudengoi]
KAPKKFDDMEELLRNLPFDTLVDFISVLFFKRPHGEPDPRGITHASVISQFLRGRTTIKMSDIFPLIFGHKSSFPSKKSPRVQERDLMFSTSIPLDDIHHARPFLSSWAVRKVGAEARKQIWRLTHDDPNDPLNRVQLRASTNGRGTGHVVTRDDIGRFSIKRLQEKYDKRAPLPMFLTQSMAAPHRNGTVYVRRIRPHPI